MEDMIKRIAVRFIELMNDTVFSSELEQIIERAETNPDLPLSELNDQGWIEGEGTMREAFEDSMGVDFFPDSEYHSSLYSDAWEQVKEWRFVIPSEPQNEDSAGVYFLVFDSRDIELSEINLLIGREFECSEDAEDEVGATAVHTFNAREMCEHANNEIFPFDGNYVACVRLKRK